MFNLKTIAPHLWRIFHLYPKSDRRKLKLVAVTQVFLSLLDLFGVAMIGALSALTVMGIQSRAPGNRVTTLLEFAHLDSFSFRAQVAFLATVAISAMVFRSLLSVYLNKRIIFFISKKTAEVSGDLTRKLMNRPLSEIKSVSTQKRLFELTSAISSIGVGVVGPLLQTVGDISLLVVLVLGLISVDFFMTLLAFAIFGGIAFGGYKFTKSQIGESGAISTKLSISSSEKLVNLIEMYREYYLRNSTNSAIEKFESERIKLAFHASKLNFFPSAPKYFLETSIFVIVLILGAFQFARLDASQAISTLAIFLAAASRIAPASLRIQQSITGIKNNIDMSTPALELNEYLLSVTEHTLVSETALEVDFTPGTAFDLKVKIEHFTFDTDSTFRLSNIKFEVPFGSSLAIVGPTGSGKTTLVDLILGFLPQQDSDIQLANCRPSRLIQFNPGIVSYVPQDIPVFNGTLAENVSLSSVLNQADLWDSLAMAQFDDFVKTLPYAENTIIGDNGIKLSGGQRQRLGLARALYTKPKLLILDEATSALDAMTEASISESLNELRGRISILLIAHRLSTVRKADKILYLENGRALAEGSFDEVREKVPNFDQQAKLMGL